MSNTWAWIWIWLGIIALSVLCFLLGWMTQSADLDSKFKIENDNADLTLIPYIKYKIRKIRVKTGYSFDITLFERYNAEMGVYKVELYDVRDAPQEASKEVLRHLNSAQEKGYYLYFVPHSYNSHEELWEGDILVGTLSLREWLSRENLLYER